MPTSIIKITKITHEFLGNVEPGEVGYYFGQNSKRRIGHSVIVHCGLDDKTTEIFEGPSDVAEISREAVMALMEDKGSHLESVLPGNSTQISLHDTDEGPYSLLIFHSKFP